MKFKEITLTQHEMQQALKSSVHKSKKAFQRKDKHKKNYINKLMQEDYV
jgi:hypothetical protein